MKKIIISLITVLLLLPITLALECYQETATISNDCGALSGGNYDNGYGLCWYSPDWLFDGDWESYSAMDVADCPYFKVDYTKPEKALSSSTWKVREGEMSGPDQFIDYYYIIPLECWNAYQNKISFYIKGFNSHGNGAFHNYCYNGSGWVLIGDFTGISDEGETWLYEEAMIWNISEGLTLEQQQRLNYLNIQIQLWTYLKKYYQYYVDYYDAYIRIVTKQKQSVQLNIDIYTIQIEAYSNLINAQDALKNYYLMKNMSDKASLCETRINNYNNSINNYRIKIDNLDSKLPTYDNRILTYENKKELFVNKIDNCDNKINMIIQEIESIDGV